MNESPLILSINQEDLNTHYCVPLWLRDEQIKLNTSRVKKRIEPSFEKRNEPIAIVCFGPSLNDTWEQVRGFKYVISCSGAHKFLIERGVIPTWHCEVDPRPHKVKLIGPPHEDVEYLISSACHPDVFKHLAGYNVKLWHIFDDKGDAMRTLPHGEWALTGGCGVGLRAMILSRFLGFTELHIFGMDGNERDGAKHAADHPMEAKMHALVEYGGMTYKTTPAFLEAARATFHELDVLVDVSAKFYGEGLVQAMAKDYVRKPPIEKLGDVLAIGVNKPELISSDHREANRQLHEEHLEYGVNSGRFAKSIEKISGIMKAKSILDYGCGKSYLAKALDFPIWEYDPAIPGKDESPRPADLVVCTDVLEHVEPDKLIFVLDDLRRVIKKVGYIVICIGAAQKYYPDGRNVHLIQQPAEWWLAALSDFFDIGQQKLVTSEDCPGIAELRLLIGPKGSVREVEVKEEEVAA